MTFSEELAAGLAEKLQRLVGGSPDLAARITVSTLGTVARDLAPDTIEPAQILSDGEIARRLQEAAKAEDASVDLGFLMDEWRLVVDAWDIHDNNVFMWPSKP